jgi:hypothetical protein
VSPYLFGRDRLLVIVSSRRMHNRKRPPSALAAHAALIGVNRQAPYCSKTTIDPDSAILDCSGVDAANMAAARA